MRQDVDPLPLTRIVSGGQSGVDRAALDVAQALGLELGGWCPRDRRAEDGPIPDHYPLTETDSSDYQTRTRLNVRDADGTLIITQGPLTGGTALTEQIARSLGRPVMVVDLEAGFEAARIRQWLRDHAIGVLNVAGPRASKDPTVYHAAAELLRQVLRG